MTPSIKTHIEAIAAEKGIEAEDIFSALELALATAREKTFDEEIKLQCEVDRKSGEPSYFRIWTVVEDDEPAFNPDNQIHISDTKKDYESLTIGDEIVDELSIESDQGRIGVGIAKMVLSKAVSDAERAANARIFENQVGKLFTGEVSHVSRVSIILETNGVQAEIQRSELLPKEIIRKGDRIQGCLSSLNIVGRGALLQLSRKSNEMLSALFTQEVPEITEGMIKIKAVARDPGSRAKIAVKSNDARIDPIGACIGVKGSRVQAISNELHGERIDIVKWDDDPAMLAINALSPAEVLSIDLNEQTRTMQIAVDDEMLSQAIGRSGQNINLASALVGWRLKVMSNEEAQAAQAKSIETAKHIFSDKLDVDEEVAAALSKENIHTISDLANTDVNNLAIADGFDLDIAQELINRAKDHLLDIALSGDDSTDSLMSIEGMTMSLTEQLQANDIQSRDDLADMSVDELTEVIQIDEKQAAELILAARSHWFEDEDNA